MDEDRTIAKHLRAAADFLRPQYRWCKGKVLVRRKADVSVCAVGAIYKVTSSTPMRNNLIRRIYGQLPGQFQDEYKWGSRERIPLVFMRAAVMYFNDRRRTAKADVLALFESAAEAVELRGAIAKLPKAQLMKAPNLGLEAPVKVKR